MGINTAFQNSLNLEGSKMASEFAQKLENKILLQKLAYAFCEAGVTVHDINRASVAFCNLNESALSENTISNRIGNWARGLMARTGLKKAETDQELRQQYVAIHKSLENFFDSIELLYTDDIYNRLRNRINASLRDLYSHSREKMFGTAQSPFYKPVSIPTLNRLQKIVYGASGTGTDGDFTGFREPEPAKRYFMRNFSGHPADPLGFAKVLRMFGHKDQNKPY